MKDNYGAGWRTNVPGGGPDVTGGGCWTRVLLGTYFKLYLKLTISAT